VTSSNEKANERRRKRYAEDPEYRETQLARRRARYPLHKDAINERRRHRYATDPDYRVTRLKKDSVRARRSSLKNAYGISLEDCARLLVRQGGVCAICLKAPAERLCVDHCHATGKVRGLLCRTCNVGLGCYRDDPSLVTAAAAYLRKAKTAQRRSRPSPWGGLIGSIGAEMPCTCTEVSKNRKIRRMTSKN
jgi:hypothetical protein